MKHITVFDDGSNVPSLGQGTWYLGESRKTYKDEKQALITGIKSGMTLIDTAEMYGNGLSEELVGDVISNFDRSKLFIVSKVLPHNAGRDRIFKSLENTLKRLGTDYLDLYLLHWREDIPLKETVECLEELRVSGKIKNWGVSNFDTSDMEELFSIEGGSNCKVNQVLYHIASRGIEYDLLPWMKQHNVTLMAYCPMAQAGELKRGLLSNPILNEIAKNHNATVLQIMIAWTLRIDNAISIPRTGKEKHTLENAKADDIILTKEELDLIDKEYPAPKHKTYLDIV